MNSNVKNVLQQYDLNELPATKFMDCHHLFDIMHKLSGDASYFGIHGRVFLIHPILMASRHYNNYSSGSEPVERSCNNYNNRGSCLVQTEQKTRRVEKNQNLNK
jgi:hypothetical protein